MPIYAYAGYSLDTANELAEAVNGRMEAYNISLDHVDLCREFHFLSDLPQKSLNLAKQIVKFTPKKAE